MTRDDLRTLLRNFSEEAFRLECRDHYDVPDEKEEFSAFLTGSLLPPQTRSWWTELVAENRYAGKHMRRIHIIPATLTPYLRFEIEWGYVYSAEAGEEMFLLPVRNLDAELFARSRTTGDYWLFDDQIGVMMTYDEEGRFLGPSEASKDSVPKLIALKEALLETAIPLRQYLAQIRNSYGST